jgi:peroxiredoxin
VRIARRSIGAAAIGAGIAVALLLTGCTTDSLAKNTKDSYTSADGAITTIAPADRGAVIDFAGKGDDGTTISSKDSLGKVLVANFWYASCAPCRVEAAKLEAAYTSFEASDVTFVGVNTYDQADTSLAFAKKHKITFPSIIDVDSGSTRLAFAGRFAPNATPTTIVLDQKGRVAARVSGPIDSPAILKQLVSNVLAESK